MIQKLRENHQQYPSDIESDSDGDIENEIENLDIDSHKQLPTKNDYQKDLQNTKKQSLKRTSYEFSNDSNFDDTG